MTKLSTDSSVDMTLWSLSEFSAGSVSSSSETSFTVSTPDSSTYAFQGVGLNYGGDGFPDAGKITDVQISLPDGSSAEVSAFAMTVSQFDGFVAAGSTNAFEAALFAGSDTLNGGNGSDTINGFAGNDIISSGNGVDAAFGGAGNDTIGSNISLTPGNGNKVFHGGGGDDEISTGFGNDVVYGDGGNDEIDVFSGSDKTYGGGGDDVLFADNRQKLNASDYVDGGSGNDTLVLYSNYGRGGLTLDGANIRSIENIDIVGDSNYRLIVGDGFVGAGKTLTVSADLPAQDTFFFDGSAERNGRFVLELGNGASHVIGGAGADKFIGGGGTDTFDISKGGVDIVDAHYCFASTIIAGSAFTVEDQITGSLYGTSDVLELDGNYAGHHALSLRSKTLIDVDRINLASGHSYVLTTSNGTVGPEQTFTVDASRLGAGDTLKFDGHEERDGNFHVFGGAGNDVIFGGNSADVLDGRRGSDVLDGRNGSDTFVYAHPSESSSTLFDTIIGLNGASDKFDLNIKVKGINPEIKQGQLTLTKFDSNLAKAVSSNSLHAHHAVLFAPSHGNFAGDLFLIVDANGHAGYQAGADYVFELQSPSHAGALSVGNFI
ncbi:MAG TPA: calcium-binding protein [Rhizomicrobium sp.]|nr:calcium-binding protein [Rhizomicrobium sp.]